MKRFEFKIKVIGYGNDVESAWENATDDLQDIEVIKENNHNINNY